MEELLDIKNLTYNIYSDPEEYSQFRRAKDFLIGCDIVETIEEYSKNLKDLQRNCKRKLKTANKFIEENERNLQFFSYFCHLSRNSSLYLSYITALYLEPYYKDNLKLKGILDKNKFIPVLTSEINADSALIEHGYTKISTQAIYMPERKGFIIKFGL